MSTLLFCTSYANDLEHWRLRYARWTAQARRSGLAFDRMVLIDDGSPVTPPWARVLPAGDPAPAPRLREGEVELHRFSDNLGRRATFDFPGWYRSFAYAGPLARAMGATKLVHVESDAALLSREIVTWINGFDEGWGAPWSEMHGFPEMAIQVIAGSSLATFHALFSQPYDWMRAKLHENLPPYTHVVRCFVGDRYGGEAAVRRDADFVTQAPFGREDGFQWWERALGDGAPAPAAEPGPDALFHWDFAPDGEAVRRSGFGWASLESHYRWTVGLDSWIDLPPDVPATALVFEMSPCAERSRHPFQKLEVHLDGREIGRAKISSPGRWRVPLPPGGTGRGELRLHHPDPAQPRRLVPAIDDGREIGLYMHSLAAVAD